MENIISNNENWSILTNKEKRKEYKNLAESRLGETKVNKQGEIMFIVKYNKASDIVIQFKTTGELITCNYGEFKSGKIKSHFIPSVYGVGITGLERAKEGNLPIKSYAVWNDMLSRCYSIKRQERQPTYIGCSVCDEWLYYSNFKKFYDEKFYIVEGFRTELDKDILIKGNKVYSPKTCVFVPSNINNLFTSRKKFRGEYQIGVHLDKRTNKYSSYCNTADIPQKYLGAFLTPLEAFEAYRKCKEQVIKDIANKYKMQIPNNLYNAMINYIVEIND